ncbi:MAG: YciI family protein [Actinopolymorphaceae bacterium]
MVRSLVSEQAVDSAARRSSSSVETTDDKEYVMKYLLLICAEEGVEVTPEEADATPWLEEVERRGVRLDGDRLRGVSEATTVRVRKDELMITDGPFAESKEQLAGYDVIDCADLDEAIEIASKHPVARFGSVEVRPFWEGA